MTVPSTLPGTLLNLADALLDATEGPRGQTRLDSDPPKTEGLDWYSLSCGDLRQMASELRRQAGRETTGQDEQILSLLRECEDWMDSANGALDNAFSVGDEPPFDLLERVRAQIAAMASTPGGA